MPKFITSMLVAIILVSANPDGTAKVKVTDGGKDAPSLLRKEPNEAVDAAKVASTPLLHRERTKESPVHVGVDHGGAVTVEVADIVATPFVRKEPTKDTTVVHKEADQEVSLKVILDSKGEAEALESAQGEEVQPPKTEIKQGISAADQTKSSSSLASGATVASPPVQIDDRFPMDADGYEDAALDELEALTIEHALTSKHFSPPPPVRRRRFRRRRAIPCVWHSWSSGTAECSTTCGGGKIGQTRKVARNAAFGGAACKPPSRKKVKCSEKVCPTTTTTTATTMTTAAGANRMVAVSAAPFLSLFAVVSSSIN